MIHRKNPSATAMFVFPDTSAIDVNSVVDIMPKMEMRAKSDGTPYEAFSGKWTVHLSKNGCEMNVTISKSEYDLLLSAMNVYR